MKKLKQQLIKAFGRKSVNDSFNELTLTIGSGSVIKICTQLRDEFNFDILIDLCGIDYLSYGESDWDGNASSSGYGRARELQLSEKKQNNRFAVVSLRASSTLLPISAFDCASSRPRAAKPAGVA